ncbi:MAG: right-handed parallel beta-helix repeat-containing protein, partial [Bacteroidota bacterium]|nr:right-handed parallel beta-helix repeat-containing protein [Bacteroidota bacterium]
MAKNYAKGNNYYFSANGNDENNGSIDHPLKTIQHLNSIHVKAGDTVFFKAKEIFTGTLLLNVSGPGIEENPIVITSYGNGDAVINGANGSAIEINNSSHIKIYNLTCKGSGRKDGNTKNGIAVNNCNEITFENIDISGFQKSGLSVYNSSHIIAKKIYAHENGFAGISISGEKNKEDCHYIYIGYC